MRVKMSFSLQIKNNFKLKFKNVRLILRPRLAQTKTNTDMALIY